MSLARVSDLPSLTLSDLSEQDRADSYFEISQVSSGVSPEGYDSQRWLSKHVSYADMENQLVEDARTFISVATLSSYGFLKLGATRDEDNYIFPLSVDDEGRAFVMTKRDKALDNMHYDQWKFVLSSGPNTTVTAVKYVIVADTLPTV